MTERLPKESVLAYLPKTHGVMEIMPDRRIEGVSIHFNLHVFNELFNEIPQCLKDLYSVYGDSTDKHFYHQSGFNGETFFVLKQVLECPYEGETRRLFYEAKSLELVALKLAEMGQKNPIKLSELSRKDLDRTREAYNILLTNLDHPPSLIDLGRLVGTNRNKLNRGFREIYGDTVFNVLRNARMARAWSLLEKTDLSLSEIAFSVGYNNQANFTTAFRKQFGKTPKTVRRDILLNRFPTKPKPVRRFIYNQ
ncbi:MAG: AraC family transcriptional regulator [Desulfobacteraceae bacterium]